MDYTKKELLKKVDEHLKPEKVAQFYAQDFVNDRGTTPDTGEKYTEVIADYLDPEVFTLLDQIQPTDKKSSYKCNHPMTEYNSKKFYTEEQTVQSFKGREFFERGGIGKGIGRIIDCHIPLQDDQTDCAEKIDLLSYNRKTKRAFIFSFKSANNEETLLRRTLEAYTYKRMVNVKKLLSDFNLPDDTELVAAVLVYEHSQVYEDDYKEINIFYLMMSMDVDLVVLDKNGCYVVVGPAIPVNEKANVSDGSKSKRGHISGYTEDEILNKVEDNLEPENVAQFYAQDFVNYRGITSDTGKKYTDVIAAYLFLPHISVMLEQIQMINRKSTYSGDRPMKAPDSSALRAEEHMARSMKGKTYDYIGKIIDYQTPLKDKQTDKAGKIDLLSYNKETKCAYILEFKRADSKDTLLRCTLEAYTYRRIVNDKKLLSDFNLPVDTELFAAVLVYRGSQQHKDFYDDSYLIQLEVGLFVLDEDGLDIVEAYPSRFPVEEQMALNMMGRTYTCIGKIIDYHIPIKHKRTSKTKKIDLLSYDEASKCAYFLIFENKKVHNKNLLLNSILKADCRGWFDEKELLNDYKLPDDTELFTGVLVYHGSQPYQDFCNDKASDMKLIELMKLLKVDLLVLNKDGTDVVEAFLGLDGWTILG